MQVAAVLASGVLAVYLWKSFDYSMQKLENTREGKKFWWQVDMNDGCWHFKPVYFNMMHISGVIRNHNACLCMSITFRVQKYIQHKPSSVHESFSARLKVHHRDLSGIVHIIGGSAQYWLKDNLSCDFW